jgi:hypothetical protein
MSSPARTSPYFHASHEPFTLAQAFDAGASAWIAKWPQSANPFAIFPESAWAWDMGWRFAAFMQRADQEGRR